MREMGVGWRFGLGVGLILVGGLVGCTGGDPEPATDADTPTGSVEAPALQSDGDGADGSSPGTLVVGGDPSGSDPVGGSDPAAPEGRPPDVSVVPPADDGQTQTPTPSPTSSLTSTQTSSGANPPDVSTQPSG